MSSFTSLSRSTHALVEDLALQDAGDHSNLEQETHELDVSTAHGDVAANSVQLTLRNLSQSIAERLVKLSRQLAATEHWPGTRRTALMQVARTDARVQVVSLWGIPLLTTSGGCPVPGAAQGFQPRSC